MKATRIVRRRLLLTALGATVAFLGFGYPARAEVGETNRTDEAVETPAGAPDAPPSAAADNEDAGGALTGNTLFETFRRGGAMMWPILLCSVAALAFALERLAGLRKSAVFPRSLAAECRDALRNRDLGRAETAVADDPSPFAYLLRTCLQRSNSPGFDMEAALEEAGSRVLYDMRRNTRALGVIADVSPLLGLMGTVVGMIKAFEVVARTGALGRTELLAQGIGEALLTTAFGLAVAVPAMLFYHYFRGKADGLLRIMEDACIDILVDVRKAKDSE